MASKIIGITVDIEGKTSGLTKSLQEANSSINKTTAALKDVDKALKLDPTNVELLAQKEALLNKQIEQTSEKLDIMRQVAEDANAALERGDITQEQYAQLQAEIVKTEQSLSDLETEANNSGDALEDTGDEAESAGSDMEAFGEAAERAGEIAVAAFEAVVVAAAAVGAAIVSATVEASTALINATVNTSHLADELLTLSSTTGLTTDTLQELNYAAELLDVDTTTVTGSMTKLEKVMSSAVDGSATAAAKFTDLGISIYDANGNVRDAEDVFWDAIDVLGTFESETERDMAAMDLFGKSAKELNPLIEAGSVAFAELAQEAHDVGYVMDGETLDAFGALDDNMVRMTNTAQAVEQSFGQVLLPLLTAMSGDAVDFLGDFSGALATADGDIDKMASIIESFAPRAVDLVETYFPKILKVVESVLNALLPVVIKVAPQLLALAGELLTSLANSIAGNSEEFIAAFATLFESVVNSAMTILPVLIPLAIQMIETLVNTLLDPANLEMLIGGAVELLTSIVTTLTEPSNLEMLLTAATTIVLSLLDGLTTALPLIIPAAINAILTLVDTLLSSGCLDQILKAALTLIVTLASALIDYLPELIKRLPEIILGIVEFLIGNLDTIIEVGFQLLTAIIGDLPNIIAALVEGLVELVAGLVEYLMNGGMTDIFNAFKSIFDGVISSASTWGSDIIQGIIDGIVKMFSNLKSTLSDTASTIKAYLGFSVPETGPLHEWAYHNPGEDMLELYSEGISDGMTEFQKTLYDTASAINDDIGNMSLSSQIMVNRQSDFDSGLSRIEQAVSSMPGAESGTWVFPIYIGSELVDTFVVDAIDRYNYQTGGH